MDQTRFDIPVIRAERTRNKNITLKSLNLSVKEEMIRKNQLWFSQNRHLVQGYKYKEIYGERTHPMLV